MNYQAQKKFSEDLKQAIHENGCRVKLAPTDQHRQNAAETAIQTFKGHFISDLMSQLIFQSTSGTNCCHKQC
ncbi:hypothetical protein ACHAW6_008608 [Cyclotella cf. meneghiniana]